jgi:hypothetical protein
MAKAEATMASNEKPILDHAQPSDGYFDDRDLTEAQRQAADTALWFTFLPKANFEPAAIGRATSWEQRKRELLFTMADVDNIFNDPDLLKEVFELETLDGDLDRGLCGALSCISDLHQYGRVTGPGLAIGAIKTLMRNCALFERYFAKAPTTDEHE